MTAEGEDTTRGRWVQMAGVFAFLGLVALLGWRTGAAFATGGGWWLVLPAAVLAYLAADLAAGAVHWFCDTFFAVTTPVIGPAIIRGFREHHTDPTGITRHDFFKVNGSNCLAALPLLVAVAIAGGPEPGATASLFGHAFVVLFSLAIFATNQFHRWAHAERVPPGVRTLQRWGLILSPERHDVHHSGHHDRGYCVTTGWLNPLLDRLDLFGRIERAVRLVAPRGRGA